MVICLDRGVDCLHVVQLMHPQTQFVALFKSWKRGRYTGVVVVVVVDTQLHYSIVVCACVLLLGSNRRQAE